MSRDKLLLMELEGANSAFTPVAVYDGRSKRLAVWHPLKKMIGLSFIKDRTDNTVVMVSKKGDEAAYEAVLKGKKKPASIVQIAPSVSLTTSPVIPAEESPIKPIMEFVWRRHSIETFTETEDLSKQFLSLDKGRECTQEESDWLDKVYPDFRKKCW
jgi:hypothetical protein